MQIVSTGTPATQHPSTDNVLPLRFVRVPIESLPTLYELPLLELRCYLELAQRCDGWKRRNIAPPRIRADDVAAAVGMSARRVQLAIAELCRRGLVTRMGKARDMRGCQYDICAPPFSTPILDPSSDPLRSVYGGVDRSAAIGARVGAPIAPDHCSGDHTLLVSRSIDPCQPRSRTRAGGGPAGGVENISGTNLDALETEIVRLFDPRWRRNGAKLIRRKLAELRETGAPAEQIIRFAKRQIRDPSVHSARFPPSVALALDSFADFRRAEERAQTLATAQPKPRATTTPPKDVNRPTAIADCRAKLGLK